ncbi:MAG: hypothetical protein IT319_10190 [Anaerolineae bacterium]|nr:hypothetical protein [Anaerolineae bacterium]
MATPVNPDEVMALQTGVSRRRSLFILLICVALALLVFAFYYTISRSQGGGQVVMPLDDAYIHFQYAHQIAVGQPYVYNPGLPPTSGATSFLYPYLLAVGDLLGFRGLNLGVWAMQIGAAGLALSAWLVYRIIVLAAPTWLAGIFAVVFALDGWIAWHFMSGMETGLVILFTLLTLYVVLARRLRLGVLAMTLLALIRPEGGLLAVIAAVMLLLQAWRDAPVKGSGGFARLGIPPRWTWRREWLLLLIPALAVGVQPLVNLLVTGSAVASGNAAKSLFGIIPFDFGAIIGRVLANFARMWHEFGSDYVYVSGAAVVGMAALALDKRYRLAALMLMLWLLAGTAAISTLDTAFWHFKRYQMPLIALFFPLAGWGWAWLYVRLRRAVGRLPRPQTWLALAAWVIVMLASLSIVPYTALAFLSNHALNVGYVVAQPLQMARWLAANAPDDARVAVHDVGTMRYVGGRTTIDIVGLTTPGAAAYWRNGPGSVGEFIERERPDLIASYGEGHGLGLGYLQRTDLYAETLASSTVDLDPVNNVALAAPTQGIYRPDWTAADRALLPSALTEILRGVPSLEAYSLVDAIDVADIDSEADHAYEWRNDHAAGSFPTEYYEFANVACRGDTCGLPIMDGGRRINGVESFTIRARPGEDVILITRIHPADAGTFDVYADDQFVGTRVIPPLPGSWLEVPTLIPAQYVTAEMRIRIVPRTDGDYMPYYHWAMQWNPAYVDSEMPPSVTVVTFQDGAIRIIDAGISQVLEDDGTRKAGALIGWESNGQPHGDYKVFMHLLNADGSIAAQADERPGMGGLPPANWLPWRFSDTITAEVTPGHYQVEIGLYDPLTLERLTPSGSGLEITPNNSIIIGEVEVK